MKRCLCLLSSGMFLLLTAGCASLNPRYDLINREGAVDKNAPVMDPSPGSEDLLLKKTLIVADHGRASMRKYQVILPPGRYVNEGRSAQWEFYRCTSPVVFQICKDGEIADSRMAPGGICLAVSPMNRIPAGVYIVFDGAMRKVTWDFGPKFREAGDVLYAMIPAKDRSAPAPDPGEPGK